MDNLDPRGSDRKTCEHDWLPVSMRFEDQLLDKYGGVKIRQPDLNLGNVYLVCLKCASWTYMSTKWIEYRLYGSEDQDPVTGEWREEK